MAYQLSKFVGRDELPCDKPAFERLNRVFANANARVPTTAPNGETPRRMRTVNPATRKVT